MALVSMRELLDHAAENGYGIPAFNVNNLEQVQAVMAAADEVARRSSCRPAQAPASTPASPSSST
jgi:fructose/tagatose bisphosphate aldolase